MNLEDNTLVALFEGLDTPAVSDALDKLGVAGQCLAIAPLANYPTVIVAPGDVVLSANNGRTDCTGWGDIMTQYALARGIAGTVIDGVCRDVNMALVEEYPLFTRGRFMRTGKDRVEVVAVNQPVSMGGARCCARDIVVADANGVVVVPRQRAREVAEYAHQIERIETQIRDHIANGKTLKETRALLGYHGLQRKLQ